MRRIAAGRERGYSGDDGGGGGGGDGSGDRNSGGYGAHRGVWHNELVSPVESDRLSVV